jgi:hypothetical protein
MHKHIATSDIAIPRTENALLCFVREQFLGVLNEARCPCSGEYKPCPGTAAKFEAAIADDTLDLAKLKLGLSGLKTTLEKNKTIIADKNMIRTFLTTLLSAIISLYSEAQIKTHVKIINDGLTHLS